jgi:hypothetical protein
MEHKLISECRAREKESKRGFSEVRAKNDLERVRSFFLNELRVNFPDDAPEWLEIQNYRLLRNCIVHHHSLIDESKKFSELENYITGKRGLVFLIANEIYLEHSFCNEVYHTIKDFLCFFKFGYRMAD